MIGNGGSRATGNREWSVTLTLTCDTCRATEAASASAITKVQAVSDVEKKLRYAGWRIARIRTFCPEHAGPLPHCERCGEATPPEYGQKVRPWVTDSPFMCDPCLRADVRERAQAAPSDTSTQQLSKETR